MYSTTQPLTKGTSKKANEKEQKKEQLLRVKNINYKTP